MANSTSARDTQQQMRYIHPDPAPGAGLIVSPAGTYTAEEYKRRRHMFTEPKTITFQDARTCIPGGLGAWELDKHGFMVITPPKPCDFHSRKALKEEYYPQLAELAKKITGGKDCFLFADLMRSEKPENPNNAYSGFAHSDASEGSVAGWRETLVRKGVPEAEAKTCDIMMCNIWHPRDRPAFKNPLCLLDGSTVDRQRDLKGIAYFFGEKYVPDEKQTKIFKSFAKINEDGQPESNLAGPVFHPSHRWVFISDQKPEEAWLFKQYDSREGVVKSAFHNSFHDPHHEQEADATHGRRSAEFRMLLTFPKKGSTAAASKL